MKVLFGAGAILAVVAIWWALRTDKAPASRTVVPVAVDAGDLQKAAERLSVALSTRTQPKAPQTPQTIRPSVDETRVLPLSHNEFPMTPELQKAYAELEKTYGPLLYAMLDGELMRRAAVATCGIRDAGAIEFRIDATVDPDGKTATANSVTFRRTSFKGDLAAKAEECVRNAVLHEVVPFEREGPNGRMMSSRETVRFDIISFPVESDELYNFFKLGSLAAFRMTQTRQRYFPKGAPTSPQSAPVEKN